MLAITKSWRIPAGQRGRAKSWAVCGPSALTSLDLTQPPCALRHRLRQRPAPCCPSPLTDPGGRTRTDKREGFEASVPTVNSRSLNIMRACQPPLPGARVILNDASAPDTSAALAPALTAEDSTAPRPGHGPALEGGGLDGLDGLDGPNASYATLGELSDLDATSCDP